MSAMQETVPVPSYEAELDEALGDLAQPPMASSAMSRGGAASRERAGGTSGALSVDFSVVKAAHADTVRRQLIRHASVRLETESVDSAIAWLTEIAARHAGYVSSQESRELSGGHATGRVVLRVSADLADAALVRIRSLGEVQGERVWADDVTEEYYDLSIRLQNARAARRQFEEILRRARSVEDVLAVQRELNRVNDQIDRMTGRLRRMVNQIRLSTITVELQEPVPMVQDAGTAVGTLARAVKAMVRTFWRTIGGIIVFVGFLVPVGVVAAAVVWLAARMSRPWRARRRELKRTAADK